MALIVGSVFIVNRSTQTEPLARQWQTFVGEAITLNSQTAVQIYENEGIKGLEEYFRRQEGRRRINAIGFFDQNNKLVAGKLDEKRIGGLLEAASKSDQVQFIRGEERTLGAKKVVLDNGDSYTYAIELNRFNPPPFFTQRLALQALVVILIAGIFCYALARYLSSPISKLREATQQFASGDFGARVSPKKQTGGDELTGLARDFDEMAEQIESLITSEKRLTQDISHELRSPLARINVALELARKKANPEAMPMIDRLENESGKLNDLIGQLLTLSKLETGSQGFEKMEVNVGNLVETIAADADYEAKAGSKSVKISRKDDAKVFGNELLLRSAVENVMRNAVRYTKEGTSVDVAVKNLGANVAITIKDQGDGVPSEDLEKLFRPFYRVEAARDRKSGGTGLGLAIAERSVNNHHGEIHAKNTGDGLLVEILLPRIES